MNPEQLIYPESRMRVLRALVRTKSRLSLREIARHSQVPVYAVQLAVRELTKNGIIKSRKEGNKLFFKFEENHELFGWFREFIRSIEACETRLSSIQFKEKAKVILPTLDSDREWIERLKKQRDEA